MSNSHAITSDISILEKRQRNGLILAVITVLIWSSYALSLRVGAITPLTIAELTLFRFAIPGLILLPIFIKSIKNYRKVPLIYLLGIVIGSGLPFFSVSAYAMKLTQVAYGSTIILGTTPLFVTIMAIIFYKQKLPFFRFLGLSTISSGVVLMLLEAGSDWNETLLIGQVLFLYCACLWAIFTVSIRFSKLAPLEVAALSALPNGILITLWIITTQPELGYSLLSTTELLSQMFVQGIIVGIFSGVCFSLAISRVGAEKTAAIGAATPVVATTIAIIMLGEQISIILFIGMALVISGVFLASGVLHGEKVS
ncbi:DMT family transporter [Arcobacteraceae bacterium]|nr:DMT family transporter [Arcobacteraceae bacterium]